MKIVDVIVTILFCSTCFAQDEQQIQFSKRQNPKKKFTYELPVKAVIKTTTERFGRHGTIFQWNDSTFLVASEHYNGQLSEETLLYLKNTQKVADSIKSSGLLSRKEKKLLVDSIIRAVHFGDSPLNRNDTLLYHIDELAKIKIFKKNPSKLIQSTSLTLYIVSGLSYMLGFLSNIENPENPPLPKKEKRLYQVMTFGGLAGMGGSYIWLKRSRSNTFKLEKWKLISNKS